MRRRSVVVGAVVVAVLVGAGGAVALATTSGGSGRTVSTTTPRRTETVTARDLVQTEEVSGRLGYGATRSVGGGPSGTVTALPEEGTVLDRGATLWEVDGGPGPALFFGDRPLWRRLARGVDDGGDVRQLEENLVALGYGDAATLTVDEKFTSFTAAAVRRWQEARGVEETGVVELGDIVYAPGPVRVASRVVAVGDTVGEEGAAAVLEVTGAEQIVTVAMDTDDADLANVGDAVQVEVTQGTTVAGTVRSVGTVVNVGENGASNSIDVVVALDGGTTVGLDDAPVSVTFTRATATGVLSVSVRALLALAEGGYAVERVSADGARTELVGVELGASADGFVAITGDIAAGDTVVTA